MAKCEICLEESKQQEKFECMGCGCYFWVEDRDGFECPNCKQIELDNQENKPKATKPSQKFCSDKCRSKYHKIEQRGI